MIDAVINDMAYAGKGSAVDYSTLVPFNKKEYFHPFCYITDYSKLSKLLAGRRYSFIARSGYRI